MITLPFAGRGTILQASTPSKVHNATFNFED